MSRNVPYLQLFNHLHPDRPGRFGHDLDRTWFLTAQYEQTIRQVQIEAQRILAQDVPCRRTRSRTRLISRIWGRSPRPELRCCPQITWTLLFMDFHGLSTRGR